MRYKLNVKFIFVHNYFISREINFSNKNANEEEFNLNFTRKLTFFRNVINLSLRRLKNFIPG